MEKCEAKCLVPGCIYELHPRSQTTYICPQYNIEINGQIWKKVVSEKFDVCGTIVKRHVVFESVMPGATCIPAHNVLIDKA